MGASGTAYLLWGLRVYANKGRTRDVKNLMEQRYPNLNAIAGVSLSPVDYDEGFQNVSLRVEDHFATLLLGAPVLLFLPTAAIWCALFHPATFPATVYMLVCFVLARRYAKR